MGAETESNGWTIATLKEHIDAMQAANLRFEDERDRRYTEVNIEKEKALKIKETADLAALSLARESQTYKEQQNDALRDKNLAQSGIYATNSDVAKLFDDFNTKLKPVFDFVVSKQGQAEQGNSIWSKSGTMFAMMGVIAAIAFGLAKLGGI
jgi:hypothetical protein